jgi:hypothetical protein
MSGVPWLIIRGSGLDLLTTSLQLQSIMTAHNQWLPKTCSIPFWTASFFSSAMTAMTDLVPIYESVTSSASVACWLTLNIWILLWMNDWTPERTPLNWTLESIMYTPFITSRRTESSQTVRLLFSVYPLLRNVLILWQRSDFCKHIHYCGHAL